MSWLRRGTSPVKPSRRRRRGTTAPELLDGADPSDAGHGKGNGRTLTFDVELSPTSYTDLGDPGFSGEDVIVFNDAPSQDGEQVGHEVGSCVLVDTNGTANCTGVVTLDGRGTIAFAFENARRRRRSCRSPGLGGVPFSRR